MQMVSLIGGVSQGSVIGPSFFTSRFLGNIGKLSARNVLDLFIDKRTTVLVKWRKIGRLPYILTYFSTYILSHLRHIVSEIV